MNILQLTRTEVQDFINKGVMRPENLKHFDICKAISSGMTQEQAAEKFGVTDDAYIRKIKSSKCPNCYGKIL